MKTRILMIFAIACIFLLMYVDQSYAITSLIDEAKENGLPYLTSVQVKSDVLKSDGKSMLVLQVDFHSKNNTGIWIDIKPVVEKQFISFNKAGFSIATGIDGPYGGEVKNQYRIQDYVEYDDSVFRLNSNESKQIPVFVQVPVEHLEKFKDEPLPILVGFELIDSNVLEKIPRDLEKLEIKSISSFGDRYSVDGSYELDEVSCSIPRGMTVDENCQIIRPSPYAQQQDGKEPDQVRCNHDLYRNYKKSDGTAFCASGHTLRELIHRGYAQSFDALSSATVSGQNNTVNQYCPASQDLVQWGWYAYDYPTDVVVTNIDLVFSAKENSHGVEFTFDKSTEGKSMIWVFVECNDSDTVGIVE